IIRLIATTFIPSILPTQEYDNDHSDYRFYVIQWDWALLLFNFLRPKEYIPLFEELSMAVVLAYQSLNSNSSSSHGVKASNSQPFTRMAHNHSAQSAQPWKLDYPIAESATPNVPIHGPAQLLPTAPMDYMDKGQHSDTEFLTMVEG